MADRWDPIQRVSDGSVDLYDVATWEERTAVDWLAARVHALLLVSARGAVVALAALILAAQVALTGLAAASDPVIGVYVLLSVVPALVLAAYVRRVDVTSGEPLGLLVVTFLFGFLFAGFAAVVNSTLEGAFAAVPVAGSTLFFFLVVGPVEETVKWLAVRLHAYRSAEFDAVVDGAVYGAFAGLGFATIENGLYITRQFLEASGTGPGVMFQAALETAAVRSFAGPGHVIYSAFAGYYLGLAKFNPDHKGPIVVKGLLVAVFVHGLYNTTVTYLPALVRANPAVDLPVGAVFIGFVVVYDGVLFYVLYRKLSRYRAAFRDLGADRLRAADPASDVESEVVGVRRADLAGRTDDGGRPGPGGGSRTDADAPVGDDAGSGAGRAADPDPDPGDDPNRQA